MYDKNDGGRPAREAFWASLTTLPTFRRLTQRFLRRRGSRRRVARTRLTREGLYYLFLLVIVFAAALLGRINLLLILGGMLLGPLWINRRLVAKTLRDLEVVRRLPQSITAGDGFPIELQINNLRRRLGSWSLIVRESIQRDGDETRHLAATIYFTYVPARHGRLRSYRGRFPIRGRYRFTETAISTRFPFGLFRRTIHLEKPAVFLVTPRLGELTPRWLTRRHKAFEGTSRRDQRYGRVSGEFYGVRPWRAGDSLRHIHWRSSAKHGEPVVRQFEQHRNHDIALIVELWQPANPSPEMRENTELAVSFAATVVADTCRRGDGNLSLGITNEVGRCLRGPSSGLMLDAAMEALAVAEPVEEDRLPGLLDEVLSSVEPGCEIVIVSTREVRLGDRERFERLWNTPGHRTILSQIRTVDASQPELAEYFRIT